MFQTLVSTWVPVKAAEKERCIPAVGLGSDGGVVVVVVVKGGKVVVVVVVRGGEVGVEGGKVVVGVAVFAVSVAAFVVAEPAELVKTAWYSSPFWDADAINE